MSDILLLPLHCMVSSKYKIESSIELHNVIYILILNRGVEHTRDHDTHDRNFFITKVRMTFMTKVTPVKPYNGNKQTFSS